MSLFVPRRRSILTGLASLPLVAMSPAANQELLFRKLRKNYIRNSMLLGAGVGVSPTNWGVSSIAGVTTSILGIFINNGITILRINYSGTTAGGVLSLLPEQSGSSTILGLQSRQQITTSFYCALTSGSFPGGSTVTFWGRIIDNATVVRQDNQPVISPLTSLQRFSFVQTIGTIGTSPFKLEGMGSLFNLSAGTFNCTVDFGLPQAEIASSATPFIPTFGLPVNG